jgi:hypothetical protein
MYDNNLDGVSNDIYPTACRFKSVDDAGNPTAINPAFNADGAVS